MKILNIYRKITNIFNTRKRLALQQRALEYRMKKKYDNLPESQLKIEIENLEAKRRTWKILAPLSGITTFTSLIGGIFLILHQVGQYLMSGKPKGVGQFTASQSAISRIYFILFILFLISIIFLIFILLISHDKKRMQTLNYLKDKLKNSEYPSHSTSIKDSEAK